MSNWKRGSARWPAAAALAVTAILSAAAAARAVDSIPVSEVHRGMTGYGLTVVAGTEIDTFRVEVLDVMSGRGGTGDVILVEASGLGTELSGIAQGMSGSPVYLDGRLAGALAFAYPFAKVPIGGVTPIGEMREIIEREDLEQKMSGGGDLPPAPGRSNGLSQQLERISTPIAVSGFAPEVTGEIDSYFNELGMVTTRGGSGGAAGKDAVWQPLPGAGVGVRLLSGDANLTAIGTITWVDGDRILAFGHPLFQSGGVELPLVSVKVHAVMPSQSISFKIGSPLETVGAMVQDRRTGIAGVIGALAPTIPIAVTVDVPGIRTDRFRYEAVDHKVLTPALVAWATRNSVAHHEKVWGDGTIRLKMDIDLENHDDVHMENLYSSFGFLGRVSGDVALPLQVLGNSGLGEVKVKRVDVAVTYTDGRRSGRIEGLRLDKGAWKPGETLRGSFTMRHYKGEMEEVPLELDLPRDLPEGRLILRVCDAPSSEEWDDKRAPNRLRARDVNGLVRVLEELRTDDKVYCQLFDESTGATIQGRALPRLPGSVLSIYAEPLHADDGAYRKGSVVAAKEYSFDFVVSGCRTLPITIDRSAPQRLSNGPKGE